MYLYRLKSYWFFQYFNSINSLLALKFKTPWFFHNNLNHFVVSTFKITLIPTHLSSVAVCGRVAIEAALLVSTAGRAPSVAVAREASHPPFTVALGAQQTAAALAPMARFDWGSVRHRNHLDLVLEVVAGVGLDLPGQRRRAVVGAVHLAAAVRHERPRRLALLRVRVQLVLKCWHHIVAERT